MYILNVHSKSCYYILLGGCSPSRLSGGQPTRWRQYIRVLRWSLVGHHTGLKLNVFVVAPSGEFPTIQYVVFQFVPQEDYGLLTGQIKYYAESSAINSLTRMNVSWGRHSF